MSGVRGREVHGRRFVRSGGAAEHAPKGASVSGLIPPVAPFFSFRKRTVSGAFDGSPEG